MRKHLKLAILVVLMECLSGVVRADDPFDGLWALRVVIEQGPCARPPVWRYQLRVTRSKLGAADPNETATITGRINDAGVVRGSVKRGDDKATGQGRLSGNAGSGGWSSITRGCSGTWTAIRTGE